MQNIKSSMMEELKKIDRMDKVPMSSIDMLYKLTCIVKNIDKIEMMEDGESSYDYGSSYRRGSGRNARRDSMGRYSRESGYSEDENSYARGNRGYSRDDDKDYIMSTFDEMIESASGKEKEILMRCMKEIERI